MPFPIAASDASGGGAPLDELAVVGGGTTLLFVLTLWLVRRYRTGRAKPLRKVEGAAERALGIPGWAALPGAGAVACALVIILGATWDIGLHIDVGRDEGPLGTAAHYPLLLGLFGAFLMGVLAVGMAPTDPRRTSSAAFRPAGGAPLPAAAVLLAAGAAFGMSAFPLDDLWHRTFGQDVTLWGPTHTMIIGGTLVAGIGGVLLLVEGARAAGRDPFGGRGVWRRPLPALMAGVFLYLWAATVHEFNWGVPQYRMVWHPLLLAFGAAQALVLARMLAGRGGALAAIVVWMPVQVLMTVVIGGPLEVTAPMFPLFVAEALIVEALAWRREPRDALRFGLGAGLAIGTLGFAAEYAWSQAVMPLPWTPGLLAEGLPTAILAGLAGGALGGLLAQALTGTLPKGRRPLVAATVAVATFVALGVNASIATTPGGVTATTTLENVRTAVPDGGGDPTRVADLSIRLNRPGVADDHTWISALAWQGEGRYLDLLHRVSEDTWQATKPVPIGGTWKSFVRIQAGRDMLAAPIRMAPDPGVGFAGIPARPTATRAMVDDTKLMQIERKDDAPGWLWTPATILVLSLNLLIVILLGAVAARLGRMAGRPATVDTPEGRLVRRAERLILGPATARR